MGRNDSWPAAAGNARDSGTVLPVANLMAVSESKTPVSDLGSRVITALARLVSEIFACDTRTDRQTDRRTTRIITVAVSYCGGPANNV